MIIVRTAVRGFWSVFVALRHRARIKKRSEQVEQMYKVAVSRSSTGREALRLHLTATIRTSACSRHSESGITGNRCLRCFITATGR